MKFTDKHGNHVTLQPGDYIRTASVPDDKKQAVVNEFVKAGAKGTWSQDTISELFHYAVWGKNGWLCGQRYPEQHDRIREVTLDQILGKPMLIEAARDAKPDTRFKVPGHYGEFIRGWDGNLRTFRDGETGAYAPLTALASTDYEIIPADPVPWVPSEGDYGFVIDGHSGDITGPTLCYDTAFKAYEGAEQAAKIMKVINTVENMPDAFEGNERNPFSITVNQEYKCVVVSARIPFSGDDADQAARNAAEYANKMIKGMQ